MDEGENNQGPLQEPLRSGWDWLPGVALFREGRKVTGVVLAAAVAVVLAVTIWSIIATGRPTGPWWILPLVWFLAVFVGFEVRKERLSGRLRGEVTLDQPFSSKWEWLPGVLLFREGRRVGGVAMGLAVAVVLGVTVAAGLQQWPLDPPVFALVVTWVVTVWLGVDVRKRRLRHEGAQKTAAAP